jgi:hypothetical protein
LRLLGLTGGGAHASCTGRSRVGLTEVFTESPESVGRSLAVVAHDSERGLRHRRLGTVAAS